MSFNTCTSYSLHLSVVLFVHCKNGSVTLTQVGLSELQLHYQTTCKQVDQKKIAPLSVSSFSKQW